MTADKPRDRWQSRTTFIIASVGAAVGLGNIWRFPFLMFKHGGGSFLIPYAVFLVVTGLPLLQAELALGAPSPLASVHTDCAPPRCRAYPAACAHRHHLRSCPAHRRASNVRRLAGAGRLFQKGDVMAFGSIHKRARGVGAISAVGGFGVGALRALLYGCSVACPGLRCLLGVPAWRGARCHETRIAIPC